MSGVADQATTLVDVLEVDVDVVDVLERGLVLLSNKKDDKSNNKQQRQQTMTMTTMIHDFTI